MCEITISITCPYCRSSKVWKNGRKASGKQNFLCSSCRKQFQQDYANKGSSPVVRKQVIKLLVRNCGLRDIQFITGVHRQTVLGILEQKVEQLSFRQWQSSYDLVQIDELYSFVESKENKQWLLHAYAPETDEVLAWQWGDRSQETVELLYKQLDELQIQLFCTDDWKAFSAVLPAEKHLIGKAGTKHIDGVNTSLRARNRRLVRKTTCFSKTLKYHYLQMKLILYNRNYHTF
jgi:insertion element IS1 protein InsB